MEIRYLHGESERKQARRVSLVGFAVDHGEGMHAGNGDQWRSTPVALVRLDYLRGTPVVYARLEGFAGMRLLGQLTKALLVSASNKARQAGEQVA